jgi:hypothetical protein
VSPTRKNAAGDEATTTEVTITEPVAVSRPADPAIVALVVRGVFAALLGSIAAIALLNFFEKPVDDVLKQTAAAALAVLGALLAKTS